jgi:ferritin-like metal-binding protein YciE
MTTADDRLDQWLRDAHAMEQQAEQMLSAQAERIESYPMLKNRLQQHVEETRSQRDRLHACMERRGVSASGMKDLMGKATAMVHGLGSAMAGDEVMKGVLTNYAFEHFEIASYRILIAAAEAVGDTQTAQVCETILREEEEMAAWIDESMDDITQEYLGREEADLDAAKR